MNCCPVLLVEGHGDKKAVPELLRRLFSYIDRTGALPAPHPIKCGDIPKLRRENDLEKFVTYACGRTDGDSVLLVVDCDDDCPADVAVEFGKRILPIARKFNKKVGIAFMHREFETLFLYSLKTLVEFYPEYDWTISSEEEYEQDWVSVRDAKSCLNNFMTSHHYKETQDQVRFAARVDLERLSSVCRAMQHLLSTLSWLTDKNDNTLVYPAGVAAI